jgi:hypothetical protein
MNEEICISATTEGRSTRIPKLKDACDMCSASKVKCDKTKPICSRCERLGYPCFYSPARRIRKRHFAQGTSTTEGREGLSETAAAQENEVTKFKASSKPQSFDRAQRAKNNKMQGAQSDLKETVHGFADSAMPQKEVMNPLDMDVKSLLKQAQLRQRVNYLHGSTDFSTLINSDNSQSPAPSEETTNSICTSHENGQFSSTSMSPGDASNYPAILEFDCATIAMSTLHTLNVQNVSSTKNSLDSTLTSASTATKRISTLLICPCSKKPDVGLLAAATCVALLDTYEEILHSLSWSNTGLSPEKHQRCGNSDTPLQHGSSLNRSSNDTAMEIIQENGEDRIACISNDKAVIMRMVSELPKVANLITQFMQYSRNADKLSRDFLQSLSALLTTRLKNMMGDVTDWIAQV